MRAHDLKGRVNSTLLAGTRRMALPDVARLQPTSHLEALSLAGQAQRFEAPARASGIRCGCMAARYAPHSA